jgi:hypothetical protein
MKKRSRKYTAKRGGFFGKDKYKGFTPEEKEKVIKLKAFLKAILTDKDDVESYIKTNTFNVVINKNEYSDGRDAAFYTWGNKELTTNMFYIQLQYFFPNIFPNYYNRSERWTNEEKFLKEILSNCTENCTDYINALKKIYERVDKPEWMKREYNEKYYPELYPENKPGDINIRKDDHLALKTHEAILRQWKKAINNKEYLAEEDYTSDKLSELKSSLNDLFCNVDENICNGIETGPSETVTGGKRKKTLRRRRRSLKKKKTRRRLKKNKK